MASLDDQIPSYHVSVSRTIDTYTDLSPCISTDFPSISYFNALLRKRSYTITQATEIDIHSSFANFSRAHTDASAKSYIHIEVDMLFHLDRRFGHGSHIFHLDGL